ncbi:MAG: TraB/GumN family protein [Sphingomonadaceae bacterium]|nr:TraB/GumN family protein [Sphingomonadaceae bacterium]
MKRIALAAVAALALISCHSTGTEAAARVAKPALWKVSDADTTIYLFGTIHLLPKALDWQSPKILAAERASQALVLETVLDKDPKKTGAIMMGLGVSPGLPPLLDRVPADKRTALQRVVTRSGVPLTLLDTLETWAAALTLSSSALHDLPVSPEYGAENVLTRGFTAAGKPVSGLETPAQQLGYFDTLPEAAQRAFLVSVAEDDTDARKEFDAMIAAWTAGDTKKIALTFDDELKLSPELTQALLHRRNANWTAWIAERMKRPGTVFVAVGAGHLAGAGSVEELVAAKGFKVSRLQ